MESVCDMPLFMTPIERVSDFDAYDRDNPEIWRHFEAEALYVIGKGYAHYSAKMIFEYLRHQRMRQSVKNRHFKLNNNFTACYARKFMRLYPQFEGFFELRKSKADQKQKGLDDAD